jgi:hypothetical protein
MSTLPSLIQYRNIILSQSSKTRERNKKQIQIGKEEVKLSIFADDMILFWADFKDSKKTLLEFINTFGNVAVYKINIQKSIAFLYTNNEQAEKEIRKIAPFTVTVVSKNK